MKFSGKIILTFGILLANISLIADNLVINGDFETISAKNNFPDLWKTVRQGGAEYSKDTDSSKGGKYCLLFNQNGKTTRVEARFFKLKAGRKYRLTFNAKTANYSGGAGVYITPPRWIWSKAILIPKGTNNWKEYSLDFLAPEKAETFNRLIIFAKADSNGKIWFDNISLKEVIQVKQQGNPLVTAGSISKSPVVDGRLDDYCWNQTIEISPFQKIGNYKYTSFANEQTSVKIVYDDKNIYFGFTCQQKCLEPARNALDDFRCDVTQHDGVMWKQDCVALMLKTDKEDSFYEVIVNGAGTITDAECKGPDYWTAGRNLNWKSNARAAVNITDGVWTVEISIPLDRLQLSAKAVFQACIGRLNISGNERSSYFPMQKGFHAPKYFGIVKLGEKLPEISDLNVGGLNSGENTLDFRAASSENEELSLNINTMDSASRKLLNAKSFKLTPATKKYSVNYTCNDKNYSFMQFTFSKSGEMLWNSPLYSKKSNSQKLAIKVEGRKNTEITLNGKVTSQEATKYGTDYKISCEPGLYNIKGLNDKFALSANGFTITNIAVSPNTKIIVGTTKFWPEDNNRFHIAENSIQPLHLVLHNPYKNLKNKNYSFNFIMPDEFKLIGATGAMDSYTNLKIDKMPVVKFNNKKFQQFKVTIPEGLKYKPYYVRKDVITILLELPKSDKTFKNRQEIFYAWSEFDNGRVVEAPQKISVNILPPLKGLVPKHFITQMWGGQMVNLNNFELMKKIVDKTLVNSGFNDLQNGQRLTKGLRMTSFGVLNLKSTWGEDADKLLERNPDYILIDYFGDRARKEAYNRVCTTILIENLDMHKIISENLKKYKSVDYISFDYEKPVTTGPLSCYCQRCLRRFRKSAGIGNNEELNAAVIQEKYSRQWTSFMNQNLADLTGIIKKCTHSIGRKLMFYSGYQSNKTLTQYGVDWKLIGPNIDYAKCGYRTSIKIIKETIFALNGTPIITGVIASPWHLTSREPSRQIDKAFIIKGVVLGSKGYLCYNIPQLDGRSYHALSETAAVLSKYEDIIYFGKIKNDWLSVKGVDKDHYALFEKDGSKKRILIVYNENIKEASKFKVKMNGNYKVYDYFANKSFMTGNQNFEGIVAPQDFNTYCIEEK